MKQILKVAILSVLILPAPVGAGSCRKDSDCASDEECAETMTGSVRCFPKEKRNPDGSRKAKWTCSYSACGETTCWTPWPAVVAYKCPKCCWAPE